MSHPALLAFVLALLVPLATSDGPAEHAPLGVAVEALSPTAALVEWSPGKEPADAFRVYGVEGATLTLLVDTSTLPAPVVLGVVVPAHYETYAVAGVRGGVESGPTFAFKGADLGCVYVSLHPPAVWREDCAVTAYRKPPP